MSSVAARSAVPDWATLALGQSHQARIRRLCERILGVDSGHVDGASLYVIEQLARDDWARCRAYQGKSSPETWLYTLSVNLVREYGRRHVTGRQRVPRWIEAESDPIWRLVWHRLVACGRRPHEVIHELTTGGLYGERAVREVIRRILGRKHRADARRLPSGGRHRVRLVCESDCRDGAAALAAIADNDADSWRRRAYEELLLWLDQWLGGAGECDAWEALDGDSLRRASRACRLSDEAQLVLRLHYVEGRGWRDIARILGLQGHQPARIAARACREISSVLAAANIDVRDLLPERARAD